MEEQQCIEKAKILTWLIMGSGVHCIPMSALPHLTKEWIVQRYNVELDYFNEFSPLLKQTIESKQ